jgi:hypothetical protein
VTCGYVSDRAGSRPRADWRRIFRRQAARGYTVDMNSRPRQVRGRRRDVNEQMPRTGDLGCLECDMAVVAGDARADLDQLLFEIVGDQSLTGQASSDGPTQF